MNIIPKFSGAAPIDDKGILDALRGGPFIAKAAAEKAAHVLAARKTVAEKLAALEAGAEKSFPKLRASRESVMAAANAAELKWREACAAAQRAQNELTSASHSFSREQQKLEGQLIETASPEIGLFISEMSDEWERCLKRFAFHTGSETANWITGRKVVVTVNNKESVMARQEAIRDAIAAAEAMRLDPDQSDVSARLQLLRNNLPAISGI